MLLLIPNILSLLLFGYYGVVGGITFAWLAALYWPRVTTVAATSSMIIGGGVSIVLYLYNQLSHTTLFGVNPIIIGLVLSFLTIVIGSLSQKEEYTKYLNFIEENNIVGIRHFGKVLTKNNSVEG
ncbi:hypothetical protein LSG31_06920 [Fodinisporobacter ferrooxydans]|uniref:Uncharacterized protein n=1 Tax=Fodinisporobacter ferrooxydans TaxID=2901836 RepID=A0ABY4CN98_9BACL|nr:hypothetical protein LSG31_06920 [Alicyclobacillaceae bacterium MYW30-H2]